MIPKEWLYKSLEDFRKKNPDYKDWVALTENYTINWEVWSFYDEFRTFFQNSTPKVIQLLVAAALVIKNLYHHELPGDYPRDLDLLHQSLSNNNLNTNDEREILVTS